MGIGESWWVKTKKTKVTPLWTHDTEDSIFPKNDRRTTEKRKTKSVMA